MNKFKKKLNHIFGEIKLTDNTHAPKMNLNKFTLAFGKDLEQKFQRDYYNASIGLLRISFLLGVVYYTLFSFLDIIVFPEVKAELSIVRFLVVCPVILLIFGLSFTKNFYKWWQLAAIIATAISGVGIVVMTVITPELGRINYYPGIMLVLFYCYMLIKLRFIWATVAGWFIFICYLISTIIYPGLSTEIITINAFFISSANILGMFGGYALEFYTRKDFFSRYLLSREQEKVEQANKTLEKKVIEKTKQLQQSQKMESFGALAGGVAHDFNNILTIINGYSDLALQQITESDNFYKIFKEIKAAGERASSLTRQLLAFSRKQVLEKESVDPKKLMTNLHKMLNRLIGEDYTLDIITADELSLVKVDPGQIEQVLMNLVINARDASPSGSSIRMRARNCHVNKEDIRKNDKLKPGAYVLITVEDDGTGMEQDVLDHIFEPFFTTKEAGAGTGLGLSVVYGIIEQHDGLITVYSEPGDGTIFKIYLPVISKLKLQEKKAKIKTEALKGNNERILLIEDEEIVRKVGVDVLKNKGYRIFEARNATQAKKIFESERGNFDLVISDVVLPDKSGVDLIMEFRKEYPELKVLLNSGYTSDKSNLDKIQQEGFRFLQKPFAVANFLKTVRELIDEKDNKRVKHTTA